VLATILFLAFWVAVALALFFVALRGGLGGARAALEGKSSRTSRFAVIVFIVIYIGFGVVVPLAFLGGNRANASSQFAGVRLNKDEKRGRELFGQDCAACHTLKAANAVGKVGPNLDSLKPPYGLVLNTINNGCLQNPGSNGSQQCLGQGTMPAQIVEGKDAQDVSKFVAKVAGQQP
jgi:mono/diheme cytochrome c family protein